MKKLNKSNGGFPLALEDIGFIESAVSDLNRNNNAHLHSIITPPTTACIIEGCNVVDAAGTTTVSGGVVMILGRVYRFLGASYPTPDRVTDFDIWSTEVITLGNNQQFQDGNFHDLYSEEVATIEVIASPSPTDFKVTQSQRIWQLYYNNLDMVRPYFEQIYTLQQSGTSAPTYTAFTAAGISATSRVGVGVYTLDFIGNPFADLAKLNISFSNIHNRIGEYIEVDVNSSSQLEIKTYNLSGVLADSQLDSFALNIRFKP